MKLLPDWQAIFKRAWSMRLMAAAALLSALEVALPMFQDLLPRGTFAAAAGVTTGLALVARLLAQKGASDGNDK